MPTVKQVKESGVVFVRGDCRGKSGVIYSDNWYLDANHKSCGDFDNDEMVSFAERENKNDVAPFRSDFIIDVAFANGGSTTGEAKDCALESNGAFISSVVSWKPSMTNWIDSPEIEQESLEELIPIDFKEAHSKLTAMELWDWLTYNGHIKQVSE
jgi:hypothetical protein